MLLQFSVNNHKSIKDTIEFSMLKKSQDKGNSFHIRQYELLKSAIVYGANASGKSNFLKSLAFMGRIVLNKDKVIQSTDTLKHIPFRLSTETEEASSTFEVVFFIDETKYRYGFEIDKTTVYSEWLYADEKGKEAKLFYRDIDEEDYVNPNKFQEGYDFFDKSNSKIKISKNQLFIWKCDQNDGDISKSILNWFNHVNFIDGIDHDGYIDFTMKQMEDDEFRSEMIDLVKTADIGIEDIFLEKEVLNVRKSSILSDISERNPELFTFKRIKTYHKKFDKNNKLVGNTIFELDNEESIGTRKFFKMSAPILDTLKNGKILIIDELDSSLHPMLTKSLIEMFHDEKINTKNAQLIFATHDTNLLTPTLFRRDQIWLAEKDKYGATNIYSLAQFNDVRAKENFEKNYIQGKYGAVPYLGKFEF